MGQMLQEIVRVAARSRKAKKADRMTQTPMGYHQARGRAGGYTVGPTGPTGVGGVPGMKGVGGAIGAAGTVPNTVGRGIPLMSVPHFSQNLASSSFLAPQRLQYMAPHPRLMLPVVDCRLTSKAIAAALYVAWSGA